MTYYIDLQIDTDDPLPASEEELNHWAELTLQQHRPQAELTLRLVDTGEIQELNHSFRKLDKPTNVLAFPVTLPPGVDLEVPLLGDVIVCPAILQAESEAAGKDLKAHWAHIVIHGVLHLLGFDHENEQDEVIMQAEEIKILTMLGYDNPYSVTEEQNLE